VPDSWDSEYEVVEAQKELEKPTANSYLIAAEALAARLFRLRAVRPETMIREAGAVLEDRFRTGGGALRLMDQGQYSASTVFAIIHPPVRGDPI